MQTAPDFTDRPSRPHTVSTRCTDEELAAFDALAARLGLSRAQAVRRAIALALIHERDK